MDLNQLLDLMQGVGGAPAPSAMATQLTASPLQQTSTVGENIRVDPKAMSANVNTAPAIITQVYDKALGEQATVQSTLTDQLVAQVASAQELNTKQNVSVQDDLARNKEYLAKLQDSEKLKNNLIEQRNSLAKELEAVSKNRSESFLGFLNPANMVAQSNIPIQIGTVDEQLKGIIESQNGLVAEYNAKKQASEAAADTLIATNNLGLQLQKTQTQESVSNFGVKQSNLALQGGMQAIDAGVKKDLVGREAAVRAQAKKDESQVETNKAWAMYKAANPNAAWSDFEGAMAKDPSMKRALAASLSYNPIAIGLANETGKSTLQLEQGSGLKTALELMKDSLTLNNVRKVLPAQGQELLDNLMATARKALPSAEALYAEAEATGKASKIAPNDPNRDMAIMQYYIKESSKASVAATPLIQAAAQLKGTNDALLKTMQESSDARTKAILQAQITENSNRAAILSNYVRDSRGNDPSAVLSNEQDAKKLVSYIDDQLKLKGYNGDNNKNARNKFIASTMTSIAETTAFNRGVTKTLRQAAGLDKSAYEVYVGDARKTNYADPRQIDRITGSMWNSDNILISPSSASKAIETSASTLPSPKNLGDLFTAPQNR